jgi:RNA polymerase sigma-70 factor, ECF subfamily
MLPVTTEVTRLLKAWSNGNQDALEQLTPLVYDELRRLAGKYLFLEQAPAHAYHSCDLVNEAFIRLLDWQDIDWQSRAHFYGILAMLMRRVLVDYARAHKTQKRSGRLQRVAFESLALISVEQSEEFIALDDALNDLEKFDPQQSKIVEMRYFGGRTTEEIAQTLNVSTRTVEREWEAARAWLYLQLAKE